MKGETKAYIENGFEVVENPIGNRYNLPYLYHTTYGQRGRTYGTVIEADDLNHAHLLCIQRGLNERIDGSPTRGGDPGLGHFAVYLNRGDYDSALHEATIMLYVALSAGVATPREALGDAGLLHEIIHLKQGATSDDAEEVKLRCLEMAKDIAYRTPGWPLATINAHYVNLTLAEQRANKETLHASS